MAIPEDPAEPAFDRISGNRNVENAAIDFVIEYERRFGRIAQDSRDRGAAGDLVSGDRTIEVKAFGQSGRGQFLWLEVRQVEEAKQNQNFWLYVVDNVRQGNPRRSVCCASAERNSACSWNGPGPSGTTRCRAPWRPTTGCVPRDCRRSR